MSEGMKRNNTVGALLAQKQNWMRERHSPVGPAVASSDGMPSFAQRHYTASEVALMWGISLDTARRIFESEPGVLVINGEGTGRRYRTLRIPESVLQRVHHRLSNLGGSRC